MVSAHRRRTVGTARMRGRWGKGDWGDAWVDRRPRWRVSKMSWLRRGMSRGIEPGWSWARMSSIVR